MGRSNIRFSFTVAGAAVILLLATTWASAQGVVVEAGQTCLDAGCHAVLGEKKVIHKPAAKSQTCKFCHKAVDESNHAFELAARKTELCTKCHKMVKEEKSQHMPAKRGMCLTCHDPHQSDNRKLVLKRPAGELCLGCHRKIFADGAHKHGPVENGLCTSCHNPHASEENKLLKDKQPDLCLTCHSRPLRDEDGHRLPSISRALENEELKKHKPFGSGRCSICHLPHESENYRLLKKPYPEEFYAPFAKEAYFCFGCHKADGFMQPRTMGATAFRNGNLNLHYRHVNKEKGRTCRACHDHHAAPYDKLIRAEIPFGERSIQISEFSLTETGGSCAPACHVPVSYDRWNPVPIGLKMSPREGEDATAAELEAARTDQEK